MVGLMDGCKDDWMLELWVNGRVDRMMLRDQKVGIGRMEIQRQ